MQPNHLIAESCQLRSDDAFHSFINHLLPGTTPALSIRVCTPYWLCLQVTQQVN